MISQAPAHSSKIEPNVTQIQVVFKTHLDMGFTDFAHNVVRRYVEQYIPTALNLAQETRLSPDRFVWTMGSWLVYHFLEVTRGKNRRRMEEAIAAGDICWHALPFTTHTELMDVELFRQGLRIARQLDVRFDRKTTAAKMTDVPGHTKAMVPLLAEAGVRFLHIGVNPASTVPAVPPLFVWRCDGAEIVVAYEKDYGSTSVLPGGRALSVNLTGDNLGPQNPGEISKVYEQLRGRFPGAMAVAGTLNTTADWVWKHRRSLPVITAELGDTWIHGVGTDPAKVARFKALCRLRSRWIAAKKLVAGGKSDWAFAEQLLMVAEHTWGMDIKTHLREWKAYTPARLRASLNKPNFREVAASWQEQRAYLDQALRTLPAALGREARQELAALKVTKSQGRWIPIPSTNPFQLGPWRMALGPDGAIIHLQREGEKRLLAGKNHPLGRFRYQLFSAADYRRFYRQYNTHDWDWSRKDFTKPGLPEYPAMQSSPKLKMLAVQADGRARASLCFPGQATRYGAPVEAELYISAQDDGIDLRLEWRQKKANRLPEALWMSFRPRLEQSATWRMEKLGVSIDPLDVIEDGNRHLHAIAGEVAAGNFSILSLDAALVAPGIPSLLNFTNRQPSLKAGVAFNLYNNAWGTNFPMWYDDDAVFRFVLKWKGSRTTRP